MSVTVIVFEGEKQEKIIPIATFSSMKKMYDWKVASLGKSYNRWIPSYKSVVYAGNGPGEKGLCSMWFDGMFFFKKVPHNQAPEQKP